MTTDLDLLLQECQGQRGSCTSHTAQGSCISCHVHPCSEQEMHHMNISPEPRTKVFHSTASNAKLFTNLRPSSCSIDSPNNCQDHHQKVYRTQACLCLLALCMCQSHAQLIVDWGLSFFLRFTVDGQLSYSTVLSAGIRHRMHAHLMLLLTCCRGVLKLVLGQICSMKLDTNWR